MRLATELRSGAWSRRTSQSSAVDLELEKVGGSTTARSYLISSLTFDGGLVASALMKLC